MVNCEPCFILRLVQLSNYLVALILYHFSVRPRRRRTPRRARIVVLFTMLANSRTTAALRHHTEQLQLPGNFPPTLRPQRQPSTSSLHFKDHDKCVSPGSYNTASEEKRSLDLTQRIERKLSEYNASDNVFKRWLLELTSWTISAFCMGAAVGIYIRINGHLMTDHEFALNCANVLGKVASAALIVPTSEALGQLKWNWFHNSKAIWDFEIFDKASRGPWGAALLLYRTKGRSLAALGALLIVLLLAIDTFFQQVVEYQDHWALETLTGTIPRVVDFNPPFIPSFQIGFETTAEDRVISSALRTYFYFNGTEPVPYGNGTRPDIPLSCPTSKCEWPEYETLAVCSKCEEVSDSLDLTYTCLNTTIDWSAKYLGPISEVPYPHGTVCGHFLNATSARPILLTGYVADGTEAQNMTGEALLVRLVPLTNFDTKNPEYGVGSVSFKDIRYPILDALVASVVNGTSSILSQEAPVVNECMLSWCIQTIKSTYEWGTYKEDITSTYLDTNNKGAPWPWYTYDTPAGMYIVYNQSLTLRPHGLGKNRTDVTLFSPTYKMSNITAVNVINLFDEIFPSSYTAASPSTKPLLRHHNFVNPLTRELFSNPWQAPNNLSRHFERMATTITNVVRSSTGTMMVPGEAYSRKNFIHVSWTWLIFPFALLLLSLAFLLSTIVKTSKDGITTVWKTSAMPTLIYGLPEETRGRFATSSTWNSSHGNTKKVRIKLLPNLGWRVSGQGLLKSPLLPMRDQPPPGWI
jgi:hypothetical protein